MKVCHFVGLCAAFLVDFGTIRIKSQGSWRDASFVDKSNDPSLLQMERCDGEGWSRCTELALLVLKLVESRELGIAKGTPPLPEV